MRTIKKQISVLLAVLMVLSSIMAVSFSVSAAETTGGTITVNSNLCDSKTYNYTATDKQIQVTYYLQCNNKILNMQGGVYYDSSVLKVADTNTLETSIPKFTSGSSFVNFDLTNKALFNSTSLHLYDFTSKGVFFTVTFDIIGSGNTEVNLDVEVITATTAKSYSELKNASDIDLVYYGDIATDAFTFSSEGNLIKDSTSATVKVAAPVSDNTAFNWTAVQLYYGDTTSMSDMTLVDMTATADKFYPTTTGSNTLIKLAGWTVYEVTLTADQVEAINSAKYVGFTKANSTSARTLITGNVLKAGLNEYTTYASATSPIETFDGDTFIISDATYGAKSAVSYVGYWATEFATVMCAAPLNGNGYSNWDSVDLYYGDTTTYDDMTKITMVLTDIRTKVSDLGTIDTLSTGRWNAYAVSLTPVQQAAIDASKYVGFAKTGAQNRTLVTKSVLKATVDTYDGTYNTTASNIASFDGMMFVIQDKTYGAKSTISYVGNWQTEPVYTEGWDDTVTIYFAAPKGVKAFQTWNGVKMYYGNSTPYTAMNQLELTKTDMTYTVESTDLTTLSAGEWDVYSLTLTIDQVKEIDSCKYVGFVKAGSYNRTRCTMAYNVLSASSTEYAEKYPNAPQSLESFDGYTFVIQGATNANDELSTYIGSWVTAQ